MRNVMFLQVDTVFCSWLPWARRSALLAGAPLAALAVTACGGDDAGPFDFDTDSYTLESVNDSGYDGHLQISSPGDQRSVVSLAVGSDDQLEGSFPAAIQNGTCEGLSGDIVHELGEMEEGLLVTTLPVSKDELTEGERSAVVWESNDQRVYVACADL